MKDKKGAPLPEFVQSEPTICFTMEIPDVPEYRQVIAGLLASPGKWFFWEKSGDREDRRGKLTAEVFRDYYYRTFRWHECMCDCDTQEQAIWQQQQAQDQIMNQIRRMNYDGTPGSVDPGAPTTTFNYSGTSAGDAALCNAVTRYVEKTLLDHLNRQRVGLGLVAVGAGILGAVGGVLGVIVGGLAVLAAGVTLAATEQAAANRQAIDDVICDLTSTLEDDGVSQANFSIAINSLSYTEQDRITIANILKAGRDILDNYLWFLALLAEAHRNALNGIDNCPCGNTWCYLFDFATAGLEDWEVYLPTSGGGGVLDVGVGIEPEDVVDTISNPDIGGRVIYMERTFPDSRITKITATYDVTYGTYDQTNAAAEVLFLNGAAVVSRTRAASASGTNRTMQWVGNLNNANAIRFFLRASRDATAPYSYSGSSLLKSVRVEGIGPNPFGDDNC